MKDSLATYEAMLTIACFFRQGFYIDASANGNTLFYYQHTV
jgi:hypothetical protein